MDKIKKLGEARKNKQNESKPKRKKMKTRKEQSSKNLEQKVKQFGKIVAMARKKKKLQQNEKCIDNSILIGQF